MPDAELAGRYGGEGLLTLGQLTIDRLSLPLPEVKTWQWQYLAMAICTCYRRYSANAIELQSVLVPGCDDTRYGSTAATTSGCSLALASRGRNTRMSKDQGDVDKIGGGVEYAVA